MKLLWSVSAAALLSLACGSDSGGDAVDAAATADAMAAIDAAAAADATAAIDASPPDAVPLLDNGTDCDGAGECASGFCVDGVCCDTACEGACGACVGSATGADDGTCAALPFGTSAAPSCNPDLCDGTSTECATSCFSTTLALQPKLDLIFVIDNSGSMGQEITALQSSINSELAQVLTVAGIDYRVVLVAQHGPVVPDESVCIEAPLSTIPAGGCAAPPVDPGNNPPTFFHYNTPVASHDAPCKLLASWAQADSQGRFPAGLQALLRTDASKFIIPFTDDGIACTYDGVSYSDANTAAGGADVGAALDAALLALSPAHFGTDTQRRYRFQSIIALAEKNPAAPADPWLPADPITISECPTAADPGTGYQALSQLTGGLRFPICSDTLIGNFFQQIAQDATGFAERPCSFPQPVDDGTQPPPERVVLEYFPIDGSASTALQQHADAADCTELGYVISDEIITLCPSLCERYNADGDERRIDVLYACP